MSAYWLIVRLSARHGLSCQEIALSDDDLHSTLLDYPDDVHELIECKEDGTVIRHNENSVSLIMHDLQWEAEAEDEYRREVSSPYWTGRI